MKKLLMFLAVAVLSAQTLAEYAVNLTPGVTSVSREIYDLHMIIFWVCVVIAVAVFGVMFYSIFAHRKSKGAKAANFHESTTIELVWTIIPVVILVAMAIPSTRALIDLENTEAAEMTVKITGHQWKWQYDYPQEDIRFISNLAQSSRDAIYEKEKPENYLLEVDKPLVLPTDTRIRFLFTSADVIHSWWVPALGVKQDANPGFINDAWAKIDEAGTYRGQCAELCGKDHAFMPIVVEAVSKDEFKNWVVAQKSAKAAAARSADRTWSADELMRRGENVYNANCAVCHKKDGSGTPPVFPAMTNSIIANGAAAEHLKIVLNGKGLMQPFKGILNDADLAAVITYERKAFGNNGSVVQPADVKAARK